MKGIIGTSLVGDKMDARDRKQVKKRKEYLKRCNERRIKADTPCVVFSKAGKILRKH